MFIPFARPLFACHSNTARPQTFLSVYKFSGGNILVHLSPFTQSQQPVFQINDDMVLANHFSVEIEFFHRMTRTYIVEPFHCQLAFRMECIGIWKNIFPFTDPSPVVFLLLDIQTFYYHKTHIKRTQIMSLCLCLHVALRLYR